MVDYLPRSTRRARSRAWFFLFLRVLRGILQPLICTGLYNIRIAVFCAFKLNGDQIAGIDLGPGQRR